MPISLKAGDRIRCDLVGDGLYGVHFAFNIQGSQGISTVHNDVTIDTALALSSDTIEVSEDSVLTSAGVENNGLGSASTPPANPGRLYACAYLVRGGTIVSRILAGYFTTHTNPSYPGLQVNPGEGPGFITTASGADAAAGAEVADTVPSATRWRLWAVEVVLVTDANVANRNVALFIDDAAATPTRRLLLTDSTNQTATQTRTHHWSPGTQANDAASTSITDTVTVLAKWPMSLQNGVYLFNGDRIRTVTTSIQAGDNYGIARYRIESWVDIG